MESHYSDFFTASWFREHADLNGLLPWTPEGMQRYKEVRDAAPKVSLEDTPMQPPAKLRQPRDESRLRKEPQKGHWDANRNDKRTQAPYGESGYRHDHRQDSQRARSPYDGGGYGYDRGYGRSKQTPYQGGYEESRYSSGYQSGPGRRRGYSEYEEDDYPARNSGRGYSPGSHRSIIPKRRKQDNRSVQGSVGYRSRSSSPRGRSSAQAPPRAQLETRAISGEKDLAHVVSKIHSDHRRARKENAKGQQLDPQGDAVMTGMAIAPLAAAPASTTVATLQEELERVKRERDSEKAGRLRVKLQLQATKQKLGQHTLSQVNAEVQSGIPAGETADLPIRGASANLGSSEPSDSEQAITSDKEGDNVPRKGGENNELSYIEELG
jgi:hypothetical protein